MRGKNVEKVKERRHKGRRERREEIKEGGLGLLRHLKKRNGYKVDWKKNSWVW